MGAVASVFTKKAGASRYHDSMENVFDNQEMSVLLAANPVMRAYFVKYIKLGSWIEKFSDSSPEAEIIQDLFMECDTVVPFDSNGKSSLQVRRSKTVKSLSRWSVSSSSIDYALPVFEYSNSRSSISLKSTCTGVLKRDSPIKMGGGLQSVESFCFTDYGGVDSSFSLDEMAAIFFVSIFPYFRESSMFRTFQTRLFTQCESTKSLDSVEFFSHDEEIQQQQQRHTRGGNHAQKLVYNAAALFDEDQLFSMLSNTGWYDSHIPSIIDNNEVSISISSCTAHTAAATSTSPLIYVNKAFETMTGYSKQEVLRKTWSLLHGLQTSVEGVERMDDALKQCNAVTETLTLYKKNGKEFRSLQIMTPVFSREGECTHYLSVQLDVTVYPASPQDIKLMQDLLALLPGMISTKLDIKIFQML